MFCPSCGASNNDDQPTCRSCGLPLGRGAEASLGQGPSATPGWSAASPEGRPGYQQPGYQPQGGVPPYQQQYQQQDWQESCPTYAGFWKRFAAYFIDGIILNIVLRIIGVAMGIGITSFTGISPGRYSAYSLVSVVLGWLYFSLMESSPRQGTLGKMALGVVVTDTNGNRISFGRATGRYFGKIVSTFTLLIGFIMAGFTEQKRALHDFMAGTLVLNKRS